LLVLDPAINTEVYRSIQGIRNLILLVLGQHSTAFQHHLLIFLPIIHPFCIQIGGETETAFLMPGKYITGNQLRAAL